MGVVCGKVSVSQVNPLREVLRQSRSALAHVGVFSCAVNLLMLTGPLFMLQIYDRVLASRSVPTLAALFGLVVGLYLFLGLFELIRTRTLSRIAHDLDTRLSAPVLLAWFRSRLSGARQTGRPVQDLGVLRQFLTSSGLPALFDLPWVPVYLAVVYLLHVWLGLLATAGAIIVIVATVINEQITKKQLSEATGWEVRDSQFSSSAFRDAGTLISMGMGRNITRHWQDIRERGLINSQLAGERSGTVTALVKAMRLLVQSSILALGAYLAIRAEITPGTMIAASILGGRALAPIDQAVGNWKNFIRSRQAYRRLNETLDAFPSGQPPVQLPEPKGKLSVTGVIKLPPAAGPEGGQMKPILQAINFALEPGDGLGVIGPSASGKSSLARLLTGIWMPDKGSVRFDGATFDQWEQDIVGKHIGYLPQSVELLPGTIRQNIARFDGEVSDEAVVEAAQLAGVHELILGLPEGYSTDLSLQMDQLSGGQVQRIALARAVLNTPPLVVLDEPNSNLDAEGDAALSRAIGALRENGSCVIVMAHRPSAIAAVNKVLMLKEGRQIEFGERDEVLRKVTRSSPAVKLVNEQ